MTSNPPTPFTDDELAEKRRYVESRSARDHWGAAELDHVDEMAKWLATVDAKQNKAEFYGAVIEQLRVNFASVVDLWVQPRSHEAAEELRDVNVLPQ